MMDFLSPTQLEHNARSLAGQPGIWRHFVEHDPYKRIYQQIVGTSVWNAWVICWCEGHDTGFHDHDGSAGGVIVISGEVIEERLMKVNRRMGKYGMHHTFSFEPEDIHRVLHVGDRPAVTIHCYSPPLAHMGSYFFDDDGELHRVPTGNDTALKPLEQAIQG